ncbi:hypothetical protein Tco_1358910, partial [Tanacetum coccineum]
MARQCTQPKRPRNAAWFKEKLMLTKAQEAGQILDEEQLAFLADPGISEALVAQQTIPQNSAFQTEDLDSYDPDCDDLSSAKSVLMVNLSSCDPEVLSEVPYSNSYPNDMINQDVQEMQYSKQKHIDDFQDNEIHSDSNIIPYSQYMQESQDAVIQDTNSSTPNNLLVLSLVEQMTDHVDHLDKENQTNKMVNESLTVELERYKERVAIFEQRQNVNLNKREKLIDSQMDDLIRNRNAKLAAFQQEIDTLKETLSNNVKEKESLSKTLTVFKTESKEKEFKYIDKEIVLKKQNKKLENIIYKMYRSTVIAKEHAMIFVIDDEETLIWEEESRSKMLDKQNDPISIEKKIMISPIDYSKPVRIEAPSELAKTKNDFEIQIKQLRIDNGQLLKQIMSQEIVHIAMNSVDICDVNKSCVNECTQSQANDTVIRKLKDRITSLTGKDSLENVKKDIDEIETINIDLEHNKFDSIRKTRVQSKEHYDSLTAQINAKSVENSDLNAQLQEKVFANAALKNELRKLKGKNVVDTAVSKPNATIAPRMFKLDIKPISHRLQNNRDAHEIYIDKTIENTDTLRGFVKRARTQNPSEPLLESTCMFTKHVQELLVYVSQTCPNLPKPSEKLVAVTPMDKDKRVRFAEHVTSSSNIPKHTDSLKTKDSNKPLLTSTRVKPTTSASGSKPSGNTKNNRITRPPSSNQKNKVKDHSRKVKSSLNKMNSVSEHVSNALVKHYVRNAKFESICAI